MASLGSNYRKVFTASVISNLGDGIAQIGYPWLASAVTRNPLLIALVGVTQRLPWLIFTLPAGVITDRHDRRTLMVRMDVLRGAITTAIALVVLGAGGLPKPDALDQVTGTRAGIYGAILLGGLLLGFAEVLRDNSAQTILPAIVDGKDLEKANGRMWSMEMVANTFAGPPLGSVLLGVSFFLPFVVDAGSFFAAAGLVALLTGSFRAKPRPIADDSTDDSTGAAAVSWRADLAEGFRWLWRHPVLRPLAITLGCLNAIQAMEFASFVLFAQEILRTSPLQFAVLGFGAAAGGIVGGWISSSLARALGTGPSLLLTMGMAVVIGVVIGTTSWWPMFLIVEFFAAITVMVWNVITVSLRQQIIPDHLLGRVNSVYRFFGWGMGPLGAALGGVVMVLGEAWFSRRMSLRLPWFVAAALIIPVAIYAAPKLTTAKIEAARAAAGRPEPAIP